MTSIYSLHVDISPDHKNVHRARISWQYNQRRVHFYGQKRQHIETFEKFIFEHNVIFH